jgi:hypothetical protein
MDIFYGSGEIRTDVYEAFYGCGLGFTDRAKIYGPFTDMEYGSFFCVF